MPAARGEARALRRPAAVDREVQSGGTPLDPATRSTMRGHLGLDFGDVRIHTGPGAEASAQAVGARAFTVGRHVVFGAGGFRPATAEGRGLLAHELAHVVQQRSAVDGTTLAGFDIDPDDTAEREARRVGEQVARSTGADQPDGGCSGACAHAGVTAVAPTAALQRSACEDAGRLHAARAGTAAPASPAPPAAATPEARAESDAAWAGAASTIDFALSILEHPLARVALSALPMPVMVPPQTRELVRAALPHVREIWELVSDPVRLMTEVQGYVDEHLAGVPDKAREWMADAAFDSLRGGRHAVGITLALGDVLGELLSNWTAPFVTAWNEFVHPLDVGAEMADLACIQERYESGEIDTLEAFTAVYGWVLGWINRYAVYVGIALVAGGAVVGALGGGGVGGAGGAAAGGVGAAPGAAVGGGGGAAAGAGAGWALSEEIGLGILVANAVHMLLQVVSAGARLDENDRAAAEDARTRRTPSEAETDRRRQQDEGAYATIAQVLLSLGIMAALVLLAAFGAQFARVAVKGLSRRYPALGAWLSGVQKSGLGRTVEEFQSGRRAMEQTLTGRAMPDEEVGEATTSRPARDAAASAPGEDAGVSMAGERHEVTLRNGKISLCSNGCGELDQKLGHVLDVIPEDVWYRRYYAELRADTRRLQRRIDAGELTPAQVGSERALLAERLDRLVGATDPHLGSLLALDPAALAEATPALSQAARSGSDRLRTELEDFADRQRQSRVSARQTAGEGIPADVEGTHQVEVFPETRGPATGRGEWSGTPRNSEWTPDDDYVLTHPGLLRYRAIPFRDGYPDLTDFVVDLPAGGRAQVVVPRDVFFSGGRQPHFDYADAWFARRMGWLDGDAPAEVARAIEMARSYRRNQQLTWHHVEFDTQLQLVPRPIHEAAQHAGGIATQGGI